MSLAVEIMGPSVEPTEGELPLFDLEIAEQTGPGSRVGFSV